MTHNDHPEIASNRIMEQPKMTALSPASIMCYALGFLGLMLIYISGKRFHKDSQNMTLARFIVGGNLAGWSFVGLELLMRFGTGAL